MNTMVKIRVLFRFRFLLNNDRNISSRTTIIAPMKESSIIKIGKIKRKPMEAMSGAEPIIYSPKITMKITGDNLRVIDLLFLKAQNS